MICKCGSAMTLEGNIWACPICMRIQERIERVKSQSELLKENKQLKEQVDYLTHLLMMQED